MELHLDSNLIRLWNKILNEWNPPMKIVEGIQVPKERNEWSQEEKEESYRNKKGHSSSYYFYIKRGIRQDSTLYFGLKDVGDLEESL